MTGVTTREKYLLSTQLDCGAQQTPELYKSGSLQVLFKSNFNIQQLLHQYYELDLKVLV